jgi:alkylation response protein AidB-like acyl-CoA dehydrogenase
MDLKLTETQTMLSQTAADFIKAEAPSTEITRWFKEKNTYVPELFKKAADLGWLGMIVPEEYGGSDVSLTDCAVLYEGMGHAPLPGPFFSSGVFSTLILIEGGSSAQKERLLPKIASGDAIVVPAITDKSVRWGPEAVETSLIPDRDGFVLQGTKQFVLDGEAASTFICAARTANGESTLVIVDRNAPGVKVSRIEGFMVSVATVSLDGVHVTADDLIGDVGSGWELLDSVLVRALPILAAYQVGACQEIFDFTNDYTRTRVVFGQPIGRFQRVQDHCVDISIHLDAARWVTYEALWLLDSGAHAVAQAHETKAVASEAYYEACNFSHMVHAGPGTDYDHPLMAHSVMAHTLFQYLGTPQQHKRKMMDALYPRN